MSAGCRLHVLAPARAAAGRACPSAKARSRGACNHERASRKALRRRDPREGGPLRAAQMLQLGRLSWPERSPRRQSDSPARDFLLNFRPDAAALSPRLTEVPGKQTILTDDRFVPAVKEPSEAPFCGFFVMTEDDSVFTGWDSRVKRLAPARSRSRRSWEMESSQRSEAARARRRVDSARDDEWSSSSSSSTSSSSSSGVWTGLRNGRVSRASLLASLRRRTGGRRSTLKMSEAVVADTRRLNSKPQDLTDAYGPPSNFLEIDVYNPQTIGVGRNRFTTYEVRMRTNLPIFKLKESCVRRRYSDFEWLKNELERDSKIVVPPLPGKALKRQLPFRGDEGIFEESFIEERRAGLEQFINRIAGHPLAQNERCLHMFLQEESIDRNYIPGKVRQ
ncbi:sorting nexin-12 isoform X1 [Arapaima gigas]